jgi:hypothetical protein
MSNLVEEEFMTPEGFPAFITMTSMGFRCAYVGVPSSHFAHGRDYDSLDIDVHGGLTYGSTMSDHDPDIFWFGFDAGHAGDGWNYSVDEPVRSQAYMKENCLSLSQQLNQPELFI